MKKTRANKVGIQRAFHCLPRQLLSIPVSLSYTLTHAHAQLSRTAQLESQLVGAASASEECRCALQATRVRAEEAEGLLAAERGRSSTLEEELNAIRGRSSTLEEELNALREQREKVSGWRMIPHSCQRK